MRVTTLVVAMGTVFAVCFSGQQVRMSAREIFYSGPSMAAEKQASAARAASAGRKTAVEVAPEPPKTETATRPSGETSPAFPVQTAGGQEYVPAAYPANDYPLGLRYSILKRSAGGEMEEVAPDSVFVAGDRIRLSVEVNDSGFLYIVHRGSSGIWKPLFPSQEVENGNSRVRGAVRYEIPPGYVFTFDEQAGKEKLFIVFSRRPEDDLERLIYDLQEGGEEQKASPAGPVTVRPPSKVLLADNRIHIQDSLVDQLRTVHARDLIVEKVEGKASEAKKEKAVYVVTPPGSSGRRVVADVNLDHR